MSNDLFNVFELKKERGKVDFNNLYMVNVYQSVRSNDYAPWVKYSYLIALKPTVTAKIIVDSSTYNTEAYDEKILTVPSDLVDKLNGIDFSKWNENAEVINGWTSNPTFISFEFIDGNGVYQHVRKDTDGGWFKFEGYEVFWDVLNDLYKLADIKLEYKEKPKPTTSEGSYK